MKLSKTIFGLAFAFSLSLLAAPAEAQVAVSVAPPILVRQPKIAKDKFKGTVVSATLQGITVRHEKNERMIRTFTLSPKAGEQMVKAFDLGGYQVGDKVTVVHERGTEVALEIKGKPSSGK